MHGRFYSDAFSRSDSDWRCVWHCEMRDKFVVYGGAVSGTGAQEHYSGCDGLGCRHLRPGGMSSLLELFPI